MINHLRTLLLNESSSTIPLPNYPGEEYVPSGFVSAPLPPFLNDVYVLMFGSRPDRAMKNYRLRELMTILHTSELAEFVYALDQRVTYWPPMNDSIFNGIIAGVQVTPVGSTTAALQVLGASGVVPGENQINFSYLITVTDGTHVTITQQQPFAVAPKVVTYGTAGG